MNVYDTVNKLAQEIKDSEEFKSYKKYKELIKSNGEVNEKIKKFETLRYEIQISAMQGLETNKDKEKELQDIYAELLTKESFVQGDYEKIYNIFSCTRSIACLHIM